MTEVKMLMPELPEGYEYTGEYRTVMAGEDYLPVQTVEGYPTVCTWGNSGAHSYDSYAVVRKVRWRAKQGENYWFITDVMGVLRDVDCRSIKSNGLYSTHNYFETCEEANAASKAILDLLKNRCAK